MRFGHGPKLVQINLQHSQAQPHGICTRVNYLTQTHLYVEHHTKKQLVPFLKSLVWLSLGLVRTIDLPNSKRILYHYTIESETQICPKQQKKVYSMHHWWTLVQIRCHKGAGSKMHIGLVGKEGRLYLEIKVDVLINSIKNSALFYSLKPQLITLIWLHSSVLLSRKNWMQIRVL